MALKCFLGQYDLVIDDKGRVRIPMKYKALLGDSFYIVAGEKSFLEFYPEEDFERMMIQLRSAPVFDEKMKDFKRRLLTNSIPAELDNAGRALIQKNFRDYAGFKKQLVAAGVDDHFELWDAEKWAEGDYASPIKRFEAQKEFAQKLSEGKS